jgi:hypothetical protein
MDLRRSANGALAGAVAALAWWAQQPLDKRVFASRYDDAELLGKLVTRGPAWPVVGLAMHLVNGAAFGAGYALVKPVLPGPPAGRALVLAMAENFGLWPLGVLSDRYHPAREELPVFSGNGRALAQSTWRHALFGAVLGVVEHRLNGAPGPASAAMPPVSSNGHGDLAARAGVAV